MLTGKRKSIPKLWAGFGLICLATLIWYSSVYLTIGDERVVPRFKPGATTEELETTLAKLRDPIEAMRRAMIFQMIGGLVGVSGVVLTGLGMIEYAAELRRAERQPK